jgi:regulator of sirC expression with transglutaminase-like and TPR domain
VTNATVVEFSEGVCVVKTPFEASPEFERLLKRETFLSLPLLALEIARDVYPRLDALAVLHKIELLADRVRARCSPDAKPQAIIAQINWVLYIEEGYRGNISEYYDPRNSYLNEVIERKTGIPITMAILYGAIAEQVGLPLGGVNLPGHYLLRIVGAEPATFIDTFHQGMILDKGACIALVERNLGNTIELPDDVFDPCSASTTVARILRNLKSIHVKDDEFASALHVVRRLASLEPEDMEELRDWGLLAFRTGHPGEAVGPLSRYHKENPEASDSAMIEELLRAARRAVAESN